MLSDFVIASLYLMLDIVNSVDNLIVFVPVFSLFWYAAFATVKWLAFRRPI